MGHEAAPKSKGVSRVDPKQSGKTTARKSGTPIAGGNASGKARIV